MQSVLSACLILLMLEHFGVLRVSADEISTPTIKVMSYNVRNFLERDENGDGIIDHVKPPREKEALYQLISEESPDIIGLMEIGSKKFLKELQKGIASKGIEYSYSEWIEGADSTSHVSLLSRFPIVRREPHTKEVLSSGKPLLRGFLEVDVQIGRNYALKVYVVHLKSKRASFPGQDTDSTRLEEARLLRTLINEDLKSQPKTNLIIMGDMNDTPDSASVGALRKGKPQLFDLDPRDSRDYDGTFYVGQKHQYERIDYFFVNEGLLQEFVKGSAKIRDDKLAKKASDHFPVEATFLIGDR
jgi:endonuclease/exonuclease/phosphatase family metal-dependent hydrolase